MKKTMMISVLMLFGFSAPAITWGAYQGESTLTVSTKDSSGAQVEFTEKCQNAYDVIESNNSLEIPFSAHNCTNDVWNDPSLTLMIQGKDLYHNGVMVGHVSDDGYRFMIQTKRDSHVSVQTFDGDCQAIGFVDKVFHLTSKVQYHVQKLSDNSYRISQLWVANKLNVVYRKPFPKCPSSQDFEVGQENRSLTSQVSK